jgi:hypothetical protein
MDQLMSLTKNKGVHVFIHNKTDRPSYFEGFDVSVDTMTDITVRRTFTERLPEPYSGCVKNIANHGSVFTSMFTEIGLTYKRSKCFEFCFQRMVVDSCKCKKDRALTKPIKMVIMYCNFKKKATIPTLN